MKLIGENRKFFTKLVASVSMLFFSCTAAAAACLAWFSANRNVDANGANISASTPSDLAIEYKVYGFDEETQEGVCRSDDETKYPTPFALSSYDAFITSRNSYTNVIIRVEVDFTASTSGKKIVTQATCDSSDYTEVVDDKTSVIDKISNVIQYKCFVYSCDDTVLVNSIDETSSATIYSTASSYFDSSVSSSFTFVTNASGTTAEKETTLDIDTSAFSGDYESCVLYIELDYSAALIQNYLEVDAYSTSGASDLDIIKSGNTISFSDDLSVMMMSLEETE